MVITVNTCLSKVEPRGKLKGAANTQTVYKHNLYRRLLNNLIALQVSTTLVPKSPVSSPLPVHQNLENGVLNFTLSLVQSFLFTTLIELFTQQ